MRRKTSNERKVLLTYDGYRCHITLRALDILSKGGIISYCLPYHTSGKTQPLDVGIYGPFKSRLHDEVHLSEKCGHGSEFDQFYLPHMITRAYAASFTNTNILSSFRKSVLWPLDWSALLGVPRPASAFAPDYMITLEHLSAILDSKRAQVRAGNRLQRIEIQRRFLDNTMGLLVSKYEAMRAIGAKESGDRRKNTQKAFKETEEMEAFEKQRDEKFVARRDFYVSAMKRRVLKYGDSAVFPRSFKVRAAIAKERKRVRS